MPKPLKLYIYTVFALGMAMFSLSVTHLHVYVLVEILAFAIMGGLLEKYMVELPNGTLFGGGTIMTFGILLCYGVPEAMVVEMITALTTAVMFQRVQLVHVLFNIGQYSVSIAAAGYVYIGLGGMPGHFEWQDMLGLMIAVSTYFAVNLSLLCVILSTLHRKNYFLIWYDSVKDVLLGYAVTLVLSFRLGFIYDREEKTQFWMEALFIFMFFMALRYAFRLFINLRKTYLHTMESLTHQSEDRLSISAGHAARTGRLARQIAEQLKLSQEEIDAIHYAALFHDIGKGQLDEKIFRRKGPRTLEEENEYRKHAEIGADMVGDISGLAKAADYVRYHHERWDGTGFPEGKRGEEIPLGARIIAAANEYDHIVNQTKTESPVERFELLASHTLDPKLVDIVKTIADFAPATESSGFEPDIQDKKLIENIMINQARTKLYESALLKKFGAAVIASYDGDYRDGQGLKIDIPCEAQVTALVQRARDQGVRVREYVEDQGNGKVYDIYCVPAGRQVNLMLFDVSNILEYEVNQEERIKKLYRDVIFSVTQGKLLLAEEADLAAYHRTELLGEASIRTKADISRCRAVVQSILDGMERDIPQKTKFDILLSTSETATNVLKHATEGHMKVYAEGHTLRIMIQDTGSGIDLTDLPKTTLFTGYSTKVSMGHGFSLLLKLNDRLILNTGPKGTTVVMEMQLPAAAEQEADSGSGLRPQPTRGLVM